MDFIRSNLLLPQRFKHLPSLEPPEKFSVVGGGWFSKVTLVFIFGPNLKFCSLDLDLDQAEQKFAEIIVIKSSKYLKVF